MNALVDCDGRHAVAARIAALHDARMGMMGSKPMNWTGKPILPDDHRVKNFAARSVISRASWAVLAFVAQTQSSVAAGSLSQKSAAPAPVTVSIAANLQAQAQAAAVAQQSQNALSNVALALRAMQNAQTAAQSIAQSTPSSVPDGLAPGGLVPNSGLAATGIANPVQWTGAQTPTQTTAGGQTNVSITQTAAQAILSWNDFNVGKNTTVTFNQQKSTWVALNQIAATDQPSQILGAIKAPGQVYLINQNGIIFGGASQINVGALVASSAAIADSQFDTYGIYSKTSSAPYTPTFFNNAGGTIASGPVMVAAGAQITTATPSSVTTGGGFVLLLGTTVSNAGSITTPVGQTELAAGDSFILRPGYNTSTNLSSTTRGNEIAVQLNTPGSSLTTGDGTVSNSGIITADTGDITLAGETVAQNGIAISTTSVSTRGTIHLLTAASDPFSTVTLGGNSLTVIEPDLADPTTALDSQRAALVAASATANTLRGAAASGQFNDLSLLPDQEEDSRIEIVSGNTVEFQNGSQTIAPGGQVAASAVNRIQVDTGALIDVAGSTGVALPVSANDIAVSIQSYETRDDPQNRLTQLLRSNTVYVDARDLTAIPAVTSSAGTLTTPARDYTNGGVLEVSGYLADTGHTIGEWTAPGGSITLSTGAAGAVLAQTGAVFNIDGGSLQYQPGLVKQSYFLGSDGRVYNVNTAPAYITYVGVFDGFVDNHAAWGVSQSYANVLADPAQIEEPGYTVGRDAGSLTLASPTTLFSATIDAAVVNGPEQTKAASPGFNTAFSFGANDPYTLAQNIAAAPGALVIAGLSGNFLAAAATNVSFASPQATPATGIGATSPIAADLTGTTTLDAAAISQAGLGGLTVLTNGRIDVTANLSFAPDANVNLFGAAVTIAAKLDDAAGAVSAGNVASIGGTQTALGQLDPITGKTRTGAIVLAAGSAIDTAGLWTNLALDPNGPNETAFVDGGAVSLSSTTSLYDNAGSAIDASAGAVIAANGTGAGGSGGAIDLSVLPSGPYTGQEAQTGNLVLNGTLKSTGFSTGGGTTPGGALTLSSPAFLIAAIPNIDQAGVVVLQPDFFSAGFSSYTLTGETSIAPDTALNIVEPTEQFTPNSVNVPTGGATDAGATLALLPVYGPNAQVSSLTQRPGASLTLTGGKGFNLGAGSAITVDPSQSINIAAYGQITIGGDLTAPSGTISLTNLSQEISASTPPLPTYQNGNVISIWIDATATLSTAAVPFTATNAAGNSVATAPAGGSIDIAANDATVIVQPGAVLDAAGSAATEQPAANVNPSTILGAPAAPNPPLHLAGAGGTIALDSNNGLFLYGSMLAPAGGPTAAGGTLSLTLGTDQQLTSQNLPDAPRILTITAADTAPPLPPDLTPGIANPVLVRGAGQISTAQIAAGGFGTLSFYALDAFLFDGDVTLAAAQSITLANGRIAERTPTGSVTLQAPYVLLNGTQTLQTSVNGVYSSLLSTAGISPINSTGAFTVDAALIDLENAVVFGGIETTATPPGTGKGAGPGTLTTDLPGFTTVNLDSLGALRFLPTIHQSASGSTSVPTWLVSSGSVNLTANVIDSPPGPISGTAAAVLAGYTPMPSATDGSFLPGTRLTISRSSDTEPVTPDDIGGSIYFDAAAILDSGVVWNPDGDITFGAAPSATIPIAGLNGAPAPTSDPNARVEFFKASITSVSAAGLAIPYGGTTDGVNFSAGGAAINTLGGAGTITVAGRQINVVQGATLDLAGGGIFNGAGFIPGAGGSVDILTTPLLATTTHGVSAPTLATNQVYAIVVGPQPQAAPTTVNTQTGATGSPTRPGLGEQIIIPAGVPGLPAGRYTLLPAAFALNAGGYRVEFDGAASLTAPAVVALPNGSYAVAGQTGIADTAVQSTLPTNFTITPATTVLNYADYDTENISQFALATAARFGAAQPALPADAGTLELSFPSVDNTDITNLGNVDFAPASGGNGGTLLITITGTDQLEIFGATAPKPQTGTIDLAAPAIDRFNAAFLDIGGPPFLINGKIQSATTGITLDTGATLTASRVTLSAATGGITLQTGAEINTLGEGPLLVDSTALGPFTDDGRSVLDVGNGYLSYRSANADVPQYGPITIADGATINTEGSIAISSGTGAVSIGANAVLGAAYIDFAAPEINIGDPAAIGAPSAPGIALTPAQLQTLTAGVPAAGVPATQILQLTAGSALNFFGTTGIDLSGSSVQLVINSPAIYGVGTNADVATIKAGTIVWNGDLTSNGTSSPPGAVLASGPGTGAGTLDFDADTIVLGFSSLDLPTRNVPLDRLTLGFATVNLNATTEVTSNSQGTLAVYATQAMQYGNPDTGGVLNIKTPLLTAGNEATTSFTAGDAINVSAPPGMSPATALTQSTAGAEIDLTAATIAIDSAIILPSGKLDLQTIQSAADTTAAPTNTVGDITLQSGADINLAGATTNILGHTTDGAGGSLIAETSTRAITFEAGSTVDVSAVDSSAGSITLTATAPPPAPVPPLMTSAAPDAGTVTLDGTLLGGTSGTAQGSSGAFIVRAQSLGGPDLNTAFANVNTALDAGGIFGTRSFEILGEGDLTSVAGVSARNVSISLDGGSITVTGTIDASYGAAGSISLAAANDLTLAPTAVLNAQGETLQTDSYGQPIYAANAAQISLTTTTGEVTLDTGATISLASADGAARGDLEINVPRLTSNTSGDANIQADTGLAITGAAAVAVNAFATYTIAPSCTSGCSTSGDTNAVITQAFLTNTSNTAPEPIADATGFIDAANTSQDLASRLSGLTALGQAFHLRPGIDITTPAADPSEDLTIQGDIDLSGFRYGPAGYRYGDAVNPAIYGSGEPGVLIIRASGNLNIYGSITDGFGTPINDAGTAFAKGWVLYAGTDPYGQDQIVPSGTVNGQGTPTAVKLAGGASGTFLAAGTPVNYNVNIQAGTFTAGAVVPQNAVSLNNNALGLTVDDFLGGVYTPQPITQSFIATSNIMSKDGTQLYAEGQLVPTMINGKQNYLPNGAIIAPGGILPFAINVGPVSWPANTPFTDFSSNANSVGNGVVLQGSLTLLPGSIIPAGSYIVFPNADETKISTRDPNAGGAGTQGQIYPLAQLLPAGDLSWSIQLVAGANTAGADPGAVQAASALAGAGNLTLADTHYFSSIDDNTDFTTTVPVPAFSVIRTGTGSLSLIAGGAITEESDYGIYTAGNSVFSAGAEAGSPYNLLQGLNAPDGTLLDSTESGGLKKAALLAADYQANYTEDGGNVSLAAQGNIAGYIDLNNSVTDTLGNSFNFTPTDALASWLWQQGGAGQRPAWWVEFGALEPIGQMASAFPLTTPITAQLDGFQGIGTLGGGNLTVQSGGNATGLNLAVASTGRVDTATGTVTQTGGGNLTIAVSGGINAPTEFAAAIPTLPIGNTAGTVVLTDLRGNTIVDAGAVGEVAPSYNGLVNKPQDDPRTIPPLQTENETAINGIDLAPGDGTLTIDARGDIVVAGVLNPGLANIPAGTQNALPVYTTPVQSESGSGGGITVFSLWSSQTAIALNAAGGDIALSQVADSTSFATDQFYPPRLSVIAQNGNIDVSATAGGQIELAPAAIGTLDLLAGSSIYGDNSQISISGADPNLETTPFNPLIYASDPTTGNFVYTNLPNTNFSFGLFAFGYDTPSGTTTLHPDGQAPAAIVAGTDIVGLTIGGYTPSATGTDIPPIYLAALPFDIAAGRDIVAFGAFGRVISNGTITAQGAPSLFLNLGPNDITSITAGRDILESSFDIAGPGTLAVQAGRNIYQADGGVIESLGPVIDVNPANRDGGAGITVIAGAGATGPDYTAFENLYLNPDGALPLQNAAAILAENDLELYTYLQSNFGYTGPISGAYARFQSLSLDQQHAFVLTIYNAMLNQSGLEFNEPASVRYKSYALGRSAIATLFPTTAAGQPVTYKGDLTMFSALIVGATTPLDSGIHTDFGGAIQILTPGGQTIVGVEGVTPSAAAGIITQGSGNIDIYAQNNVLLGESRVLTTFGGNILIWSAQGNINAGRGNKTSINVPPVQVLYDNYGNVVLSPTVPTTGAGIGTLDPIPQVIAGNINLVAPLGTVDAGEAGIRVSGNLNIAAAHVANGANISVGGTSAGVPTAPSVNVGALTTAGNSAGAADQAAQSAGKTTTATALPSIWIVDILGYGGPGNDAPQPDHSKHKPHAA